MTTAARSTSGTTGSTVPVTALLVETVRDQPFASLPADVVAIAKQCLLDWLGVTLAGSGEPAASIVREEVLDQGGHPQATLIGTGERVATLQAALVNGTASHALDYDDVHMAMSGHPTVPVVPAILALAEHEHRGGGSFIEAFVAGLETECRAGSVMLPGHYALGWHATATLGTLGAAAACSQILGLDPERSRHALGIAATQAAGFKSMFGTMCKPFHAGRAAASGLLAARLAAKGFISNPEAIETAQGMAATQTTTFNPAVAESWTKEAFAIRDVLFKYHAACYGTHSTIEGALRLREQGLRPGDIDSIELRVPPAALGMCNIPEPRTALEGKFSLRFTAALAIATGDATEQSFTAKTVGDPALVALRDRVHVAADEDMPGGATEVIVTTASGQSLRAQIDVNTPDRDLARQQRKLEAKFRSLAIPVLGEARAAVLLRGVNDLENCLDIGDMVPLAVVRGIA